MPRGGVSVTIREKDRGLAKLVKELEAIKQTPAHVKVGVLDQGKGGESRDGDLTNAELAVVLEYGTEDIPARPFVGGTFEEKREEYATSFIPRLCKAIYEGRITRMQALEMLGLRMATDIKNNVTQGEGIPPPNAPSTVAAKGSDRPLVDTGRLVGAITYAVVEGKPAS